MHIVLVHYLEVKVIANPTLVDVFSYLSIVLSDNWISSS